MSDLEEKQARLIEYLRGLVDDKQKMIELLNAEVLCYKGLLDLERQGNLSCMWCGDKLDEKNPYAGKDDTGKPVCAACADKYEWSCQ